MDYFNNFKPKKSLGQNFLINSKIIDLIISAGIEDNNFGCLEIGPGMGALTEKLVKARNKILAIEIDKNLVQLLKIKYQNFSNFQIINEDILKINLSQILAEHFSNKESISIISNLPYYITTPIIFQLVKLPNLNVKNLVLMMQKEVGERILAHPNSRLYNNLSVVCQFYFDIIKITNVSRNNFRPIPKVDSIVLKFTYNKKYEIKNEEKFLFLIKAMFFMKRKTILNNLAKMLNDRIKAEQMLIALKLPFNLRAENLTLVNFYNLFTLWEQEQKKDGN